MTLPPAENSVRGSDTASPGARVGHGLCVAAGLTLLLPAVAWIGLVLVGMLYGQVAPPFVITFPIPLILIVVGGRMLYGGVTGR